MTQPSVPHDAFFKQVVGDPDLAGRFLREHLPAEVAALLGPEPPEPLPGSFVDEKLGQHHSDLLFRLRLSAGGEALAYFLVEHKSAPDPRVGLQLLRYMARIWERWSGDHGGDGLLPPIVPVVFHHGPRPWRMPADFATLFGVLPEPLRPYLPAFRFALVDLAAIEDDALSRHVRLRAFLKALKYILRPDLPERIELVLAEAPALDVMDVVLILTYIGKGPVAVGEEIVRAALRHLVPAREEEIMASFGQRYFEEGKASGLAQGIQQGRLEGKAEGKAEMFLEMLRLRFGPLSPAIEERVRSADDGRIHEWSRRFVNARDLAEVFDRAPRH